MYGTEIYAANGKRKTRQNLLYFLRDYIMIVYGQIAPALYGGAFYITY